MIFVRNYQVQIPCQFLREDTGLNVLLPQSRKFSFLGYMGSMRAI